ncbi:secreted protein, partial [Candidatus Magnetobacterium bavaricum]
MKTYRTHILIAALLSMLVSCTDVALGGKAAPDVKKDPSISSLPPKKPVHIKLQRNFKGEYGW